MEATAMVETAADQAAVVVLAKSTSDGYATYKAKKKEKLILAEKMTAKEFCREVLSLATTVLFLGSLVIGCIIAIKEANRISQFKQKILIDRPATAISGSNFMVLSNNEYCNYIIETVLEEGYSAAAAGRVMFMCLYATVPHLISPHGQQMYLTVDKWGNITDSAVNRQSGTKQYNISDFDRDVLPKLIRLGRYHVGFSENIAFQRRLYEMSEREQSDEAIEIFKAESHDLEEALRADKYVINPMTCPQYFTSWGSGHVGAELMDQSYILKYLLGKEQGKCNRGDYQSCEKLHKNYYNSLKDKYEGEKAIIKNPFNNETIPPFVLINATSDNTVTILKLSHKNVFIIPNLEGVEKEVREKNRLLQSMNYRYSQQSHEAIRESMLNIIYEANVVTKPRNAMIGFLIVDNNRGISMGAGGMRERSGSKECHQGAFLDSNSDILGRDTDFAAYHHRFIPVLRVDQKKKRVITASFIVAEDINEALQYVFNYIHISSTGTSGYPYRNYGKDIRSPIIIKRNNQSFKFVKGMPYKEVGYLKTLNPDAVFHEVAWDQIKMDVFGVKMNSTHLKAYYMDKKGRFAALASQ